MKLGSNRGRFAVYVVISIMMKESELNYRLETLFEHFPNVAMIKKQGRLYGVWIVGNDYRRKTKFHGEFPKSFIERIYALFPDAKRILHIFSGTIEQEFTKERIVVTVDSNPLLNPSICCNAAELSDYFFGVNDGDYDLSIADPPYADKDCEIYGCKMPNKRLVVKEIRRVTKTDGWLVWLDLMTPIWSKKEWELKGLIQLWCGSNKKVRTVTLFQAV